MINITIEGVVWSIAWFFVLCLGFVMSSRRYAEWSDTPRVPPAGYSAAKGEFVMWAAATVGAFVSVVVGLIHTFLDTPSIEAPPNAAEIAVLVGLCILPFVFLAGMGYNSILYTRRRRQRVQKPEREE